MITIDKTSEDYKNWRKKQPQVFIDVKSGAYERWYEEEYIIYKAKQLINKL